MVDRALGLNNGEGLARAALRQLTSALADDALAGAGASLAMDFDGPKQNDESVRCGPVDYIVSASSARDLVLPSNCVCTEDLAHSAHVVEHFGRAGLAGFGAVFLGWLGEEVLVGWEALAPAACRTET